jgi:hypothetical protein
MSTLEQAADALSRRDYETASNSIEMLLQQQPDNPLVKLYAAQLAEGNNHLDRSLEIYRELLQLTVTPKILTPARDGIARILARRDRAKQQALNLIKAEAAEDPQPAILILEPMAAEDKQAAAQKMAQILNIDAYSARLLLPSRGWKFYRQGNFGELNYYQQQLQQAEIPSFCVALADLRQSYIFNVVHIRAFAPQARIACTDDRRQERVFNFDWAEVSLMTMGLLPIFEEVFEMDAKNRTLRKPKILDYIQVCDLHIQGRRSIFRLCSQTYDFSDRKQAGESSDLLTLTGSLKPERKSLPVTSRDNWQHLISMVKEHCPDLPIQDNFTPFAETALNHPEFLEHINPHLELLRRADSNWDRAFQLYSALSLCKATADLH